MIRLYIENQEMDVTAGFSHQITYAVDDLQNLDSKATAFSKTIVLPGTAKNNYLLGNIFEFSNANFTGDGANVGYNFNASKSAKCRLEINGLQIIKGVLRLMEIIRDDDSIEYEVAIFGELGGFFTSLGNKKLTDLDFSLYDHYYEESTITEFWEDTSYYAFTTLGESSLVNGSPAYIDIFEDVTEYIKIGDPIQVFKKSNYASYGQRTVTSISWDGVKTHIEVSSNWSPNPTTSFQVIIRVLYKKGFGIYYPLIDYGNYSTNKHDYKIKTFRPALHVFEYIDKIIKENGYTWESKFFNSNFFKRLIVPHNESILNTLKQDIFGGKFYGWFYLNYPNNKEIPLSKLYGEYFNTQDDLIYTYTGQNTTSNIIGTINLIDVYPTTDSFKAFIRILKNGVPYSFNIYPFEGYGKYSFLSYSININEQIQLNTNDTIQIQLYVTQGNVVWGYYGYCFSGNININSLYPLVSPVEYNDNVQMSQCIPKNILQKDFFASILKMFYLMVTEDKYKEKHLKIEPFTWFYNLNSDSYIDWSMKLDRSQPIRIKPMSEINARYYEVKFKSDNDYFNEFYRKRYNQGYGDIKFDNELEFAKDSQNTDVIFSSTPLLGYSGEDKIVPTILKWDGKVIGTNEETVNSNIRIMQKKGISGVNEWNLLDDSGNTLSTNTKYPYAGHFDDPDVPASDLNFGATKQLFFNLQSGALGNNLFNTFYSSYLAEITDKDSRLVTAKFKLNDTDIFNLDFGRFIYLDGVLYRLSRVVDYTPGEICTVELLRVIYTTYDSSVNASDDPEININGQIWKLNNLNTSYYANGDEIPQITDASAWENATDGAWCYYANVTNNGIIYGKLYNWFAVNDPRGLAPDGWRVPTVADFTTLLTYTGGDMYKIKESGTLHWNTNNGTNESGFTALGAGERDELGAFQYLKNKGRFWTSEEYDETLAFYSGLNDNSSTSQGDKGDKHFGFSVRLIKDV